MKHGLHGTLKLCRSRNDRGSLMLARQCCLNSTPVLIYLQRSAISLFSGFHQRVLFRFKLIYVTSILKISVSIHHCLPQIVMWEFKVYSLCFWNLVLSLTFSLFLKCFPLFCPCVRLSRVYCSHIHHFWFMIAFLLMGWILLCFDPCKALCQDSSAQTIFFEL